MPRRTRSRPSSGSGSSGISTRLLETFQASCLPGSAGNSTGRRSSTSFPRSACPRKWATSPGSSRASIRLRGVVHARPGQLQLRGEQAAPRAARSARVPQGGRRLLAALPAEETVAGDQGVRAPGARGSRRVLESGALRAPVAFQHGRDEPRRPLRAHDQFEAARAPRLCNHRRGGEVRSAALYSWYMSARGVSSPIALTSGPAWIYIYLLKGRKTMARAIQISAPISKETKELLERQARAT